MKSFINLIALLIAAVLLIFIGTKISDRSFELSIEREQTTQVLGESLGKMSDALDTMAQANIEMAKANQQQTEVIKLQHVDFVAFANKTFNSLNRIIIFILAAIVCIIALITIAYVYIKKGYY